MASPGSLRSTNWRSAQRLEEPELGPSPLEISLFQPRQSFGPGRAAFITLPPGEWGWLRRGAFCTWENSTAIRSFWKLCGEHCNTRPPKTEAQAGGKVVGTRLRPPLSKNVNWPKQGFQPDAKSWGHRDLENGSGDVHWPQNGGQRRSLWNLTET